MSEFRCKSTIIPGQFKGKWQKKLIRQLFDLQYSKRKNDRKSLEFPVTDAKFRNTVHHKGDRGIIRRTFANNVCGIIEPAIPRVLMVSS